MGAKKTLVTPIKQNSIAGIAKNSQTKKVIIKHKDCITNIKSSPIPTKDKDNKKNETKKSSSLDNKIISKKASLKPIANNAKAIEVNKDALKKTKNTISSLAELKKNKIKNNLNDNNNVKKQLLSKSPTPNKINKLLASEVEKKGTKSKCLTVDNKTNDKSDKEVKLNLNREECNKEEESSNLMIGVPTFVEDVTKVKEKLSENKLSASSNNNAKISNIKNDDGASKKKNNEKSKSSSSSSSKILKRIIKEKESKIKISNELKNLGIDMSPSSPFDAIQEDLSSGVKTSICEMVKLKKARYYPNSSNPLKPKAALVKTAVKSNTDNKNQAIKVSSSKETQEKVSVSNEIVETKTVGVIEISGEKNNSSLTNKAVVKEGKIKPINSLLTSQKGTKKITAANELKNYKIVSNIFHSKPVKRKYVKKKIEIHAAINKNKDASIIQTDVCKQVKSGENCIKIPSISNSTEKKDEIFESISDQNDESIINQNIKIIPTRNQNNEKPKTSKEKLQNQKVKPNESIKISTAKKSKIQTQLKSAEKVNNISISDSSPTANKEKRKYTKKIESSLTDDSTGNLSSVEIFVGNVKTINENIRKKDVPVSKIFTTKSKAKPKETEQVEKSKTNESCENVYSKKSLSEKVQQQRSNAKIKIERNKSVMKKDVKSTPTKKQNASKEKDPLKITSSESESSSENENSDMEFSGDIFKKPEKPQNQHALRNKKFKQIGMIKRSRVASLNAIAKVHCLYENEARSHLDSSFSKVIKKPVQNTTTVCKVLSEEEDQDDADDDDESDKESECVLKR